MNNQNIDSHNLLSLIVESFSFGVWSWDLEKEKIFWDPGMLNLYGVQNFSGNSADWKKMIFSDDIQRIKKEYNEISNDSNKFSTWFRIIKEDQNDIRVRSDSFIERTPSGKPIRLVGINRDITKEYQTLQELTEQKSLLSSIVDILPVAVFMKDVEADLKFTVWNKAAENLWGLKNSEVLDKNDYNFFPKDESDLFRIKDIQVIESGIPVVIDEEMITLPSKEVRYLRTQKVPVNGRYLLGVSEDITIQKESQLKLIESSKMSSLGEMAGNIAHEINSPLTIIQGKVDILKRKITAREMDPEKMIEELDKIKKTSERIAKTVKGLRFYSRNSDTDPMETSSIQQIIEDTLELCQERYKSHNVSLIFSEAKNYKIECRPTQISQVIMNLLSNALDAASVTDEKWVKISIDSKDNYVKIIIIDSGHGIRQDILSKIMDPFFTTKEIGKGTGLGLSISQGIIKAHNGELFYDHTIKNTSFVILLPIKTTV